MLIADRLSSVKIATVSGTSTCIQSHRTPSDMTFTTCEDGLISAPLLGWLTALAPGGAPAGLQSASHTVMALRLHLRLRLVMQ